MYSQEKKKENRKVVVNTKPNTNHAAIATQVERLVEKNAHCPTVQLTSSTRYIPFGRLSLERSVSRDNIMAEREELEEPAERREAAGRDQEAEEDEVKPVNKNKRYRRDKPWDGEHIDHWTVSLSRRSGSLSTHQFTPAICSSFSGMLNSHLICHACAHTY